MAAVVEVERCPPQIATMEMHFSDLDIKNAPVQPTPPPPAAKLEKRRPRTQPAQQPRPVPLPLPKSNSNASDNTHNHEDSGYVSIASTTSETFDTPETLKPERSQQPGFGFAGFGFALSKLHVFNKPIPNHLQFRFYDLKVLYGEDLLKAVYKKNLDQKDLSMKLKYLGKSEPTAQLYIVVQCEAKYAKKVKKFFAQSIVQEHLRDDFKLHIINRAPQPLASVEKVNVFGQFEGNMETMCGQPIMLSNGESSVFATIGGVIQVVKDDQLDPELYGFTAAHSLITLIKANSSGECDSLLGDDSSESSEEDDDDDDDDELNEDEEILFDDPGENDLETEAQSFNIHNAVILGTIVANSFFNMPLNRDWSLVSLSDRSRLPNLMPHPSKGVKGKPIFFSTASLPWSYCINVINVNVITCRGPIQGRVESGKSFLFSAPGSQLIQTLDLTLEVGFRLLPGDSGSWVVESSSGRVLGHVASIDAFGEAFVVPIGDTLDDIRDALDARRVNLPTQEEVQKLQPPKLSADSAPSTAQPAPDQSAADMVSKWVVNSSVNSDPPVTAPLDPRYQEAASTTTVSPSETEPNPTPEKKTDSDKALKRSVGSRIFRRWSTVIHNARKKNKKKPVGDPKTLPANQPTMQSQPVGPATHALLGSPQQPYEAPYAQQIPVMPYGYFPGMSIKEAMHDSPYAYPQPYGYPQPSAYGLPVQQQQQPQQQQQQQQPILGSPPLSGYSGPHYNKAGHDSGYSSLQSSASPSPPSGSSPSGISPYVSEPSVM